MIGFLELPALVFSTPGTGLLAPTPSPHLVYGDPLGGVVSSDAAAVLVLLAPGGDSFVLLHPTQTQTFNKRATFYISGSQEGMESHEWSTAGSHSSSSVALRKAAGG